MLKKFIKNIFVLIVALLICLTLLELLSRQFFPEFNPSGKIAFYKSDTGTTLGARNFSGRLWNPNGDYDVAVSTNEYGFREKKELQKSRPGDLFVVGDSFMFGWGVEEDRRLSNLLEKRLGLPVFNIAIPGDFNDYSKLISYARANGAVITELIIGVCMENDLGNYYHTDKTLKAYKQSPKLESPLGKIKNILTKKSGAYNLLAYKAHHSQFLEKVTEEMGFAIRKIELVPTCKYNEVTINDSARKLKEISEPFNTTIVIIPSRGLWIGENQANERLVHDEFIKALKKLNLQVIDLRPYFEEGGHPLQYSFKNEGHWNERGHQKAAEVFVNSYKSKTARAD